MTDQTRELIYSGVQLYHDQGIKGAGVRVVNCESVLGDHGAKTTEVIRLVAPEAEIINCSVSSSVSANGASLHFVHNGICYTPEAFYETVRPDIMTASLGGKKPRPELAELIKPMIDHGVVFFNCIGNTMDDANYGFFIGQALTIGTAGWQNQDYTRIEVRGYSMPDPDFVAFEGGKYQGTSFSTPFAAGMAALVMQDRGRMSQYDLEILFSRYAEPIDTVEKCGHGILIMPPFKEVEKVFEDVDAERWSAEAIRWCAEKGYIKGYPDGTFRPEDPVTREQLAVILKRLGGKGR